MRTDVGGCVKRTGVSDPRGEEGRGFSTPPLPGPPHGSYGTELDRSTGAWWPLGDSFSSKSVSWAKDEASALGGLVANSVMLKTNCRQPSLM